MPKGAATLEPQTTQQNTTVWTDSRQGSRNQTHYCLCQRLHWNRSAWNVVSLDCLAETKWVCF